MPKYIEVQGATVEFPDEMSMDQIKGALDKQFGHSAAPEQPKPYELGYQDDRSIGEVGKDFQSMSPLRQAGEVAAGVGESAVSMGTAIAGGIYGSGAALGALPQHGVEGAAQAFKQGMSDLTYNPRTSGGQLLNDYLGRGIEAVKSGVGMLGGNAPAAQQAMGFHGLVGGDQEQATSFSEPARTAGEYAVDAALIAGPVHGIGRGIKAREAAREADKTRSMVQEAQDVANRLDAEKQRQFATGAKQQEFTGFDELRKEAEPRTPYNLPESLRNQLEQELNPPVEQRQLGQPELFTNYPDNVPDIRPARPSGTPMEYNPVEGGTTQGGKMALGIGQEALRDGAGPTQLSMPGLDYPTQKPRLRGPEATMESGTPEEVAKAVRMEFARRDAEAATQRIVPDLEGPSPNKALGFNYDLYNKQYSHGGGLDAITGARAQLESIVKNSAIPYFKELAKLLLEDKTFNPRFSIRDYGDSKLPTGANVGGQYRAKHHEVSLNARVLGNEPLTLHEYIHAATTGAIEGVLRRKGSGFDHLFPAVSRLSDLYNGFKTAFEKSGSKDVHYGLTNIHEFIAEGFTNPRFQAFLAKTPLPANLRVGPLKTYWDKFVAAIGKLLGFDREKQNYLSELIRVGADIIQGADSNVRRTFEIGKENKMWEPGDIGGSYTDFKTELGAKGIKIPDEAMKAIWEKQNKKAPEPKAHPKEVAIKVASGIKGLKDIQNLYADSRTLDEIKPDLLATKKDTLADQASLNTVGKILHGRFIAKDNPLLSWVSSQVHWNKQGAIQRANERLHGKNRKNPSEGSYNYVWKQLKSSEREAVNEVGWALNNAEASVGRDGIQAKAREVLKRELSPKELQAYEDRVSINNKVLDDINAFMAKEGRPPINKLPHYWSPAVFDGPFKVKFLDKEGNTVKVHAAYLKPNLEKLQKAFPDYKLVEVPDSGLRGTIDWAQFDWILRQLDKEARDPASKAITEGLKRMGFSKHGLKRKGVAGAAGSEGGGIGMKKYEEISERYIRSAYDYIANRELDKLYQQVNDLKEANHLEFSKTFALEAIDVARGESNATFDQLSRALSAAITGTISFTTAGKLNLPQRFVRDVMRHSNRVKTTLLIGLGNVVHLGAQLLQAPTFMPPKILSMLESTGLNPTHMMGIMGRTGKKMLDWNKDVDAQKLDAIGAFEPTFRYDWSTYAGDSNPHYKRTITDVATGVSLLTWIEAQAVRRPAALMFLETLREIGYDKIAKRPDEIYQVAKEMTDQYMVSTRFYEKPHVFSRTGLVGMALSPLQSFSTTWLGMFREYAKTGWQGVKEGSVSKQLPMATFLGMSLMTSGMMGLVGVKEWDALANLLNKYTDMNVPTGTEYIMSKFKSDKLRFGLLSEATGYNVGASFASPSLVGAFAPGAQLMLDVSKAAWAGIKSTGVMGEASKPTNVEAREALKGIAPRFFPAPQIGWGGIEEHFSRPGMPYQESSSKAGPYTRTEKDWTARKLGTYTLDEAKEKAKYYTAKKDVANRSVRFGNAMNQAVDRMLNKDVENLPIIWKKLVEQGFTGQEIVEGLKREIMTQVQESDVKGMGQGRTSKQRELIQLYQQLQ